MILSPAGYTVSLHGSTDGVDFSAASELKIPGDSQGGYTIQMDRWAQSRIGRIKLDLTLKSLRFVLQRAEDVFLTVHAENRHPFVFTVR